MNKWENQFFLRVNNIFSPLGTDQLILREMKFEKNNLFSHVVRAIFSHNRNMVTACSQGTCLFSLLSAHVFILFLYSVLDRLLPYQNVHTDEVIKMNITSPCQKVNISLRIYI